MFGRLFMGVLLEWGFIEMDVKLTRIAEKKLAQLGGDVCGVLVRKDGRLAAVDEHGRVQWLQDDGGEYAAYLEGMNSHLKAELEAARAQSGQGAEPVGFATDKHLAQSLEYFPCRRESEWNWSIPLYTNHQPAQQGLADRYRRQLFKCQDELNNLRSEYYNRVAELEGDIEELRNGQGAEPVAYAIEIDGVVHNIGFDKRSLEIVARQVYGRTLQIRPLVLGGALNKQSSDR